VSKKLKQNKNPRQKAITSLRSTLKELKNVDKDLPSSADVFKKIELFSTQVVRASLQQWSNAYDDAKDLIIQDRNELLEIYETIEIDTHVSAITETINNNISQREYQIQTNGVFDQDKTDLFRQTWFDDFLSMVLDTTYWGFTGIQLGDVVDDKFTEITLIPRQNIYPEQNAYKVSQFNNDDIIPLDSNENLATWSMILFPQLTSDQYKLGKYNKISKMFILKRDVIQFWAIYNELFGVPYRVTKTDITDKVRRGNAENAMKEMSLAAFSVIDTNDEIEFISTTGSSGNGFETFNKFIEFCNKEMSKAILGSTMVLEDGSSRSQSEVHLKNTMSFIESRAKWARNVINDELIPRMIKIGFPLSEGDKFEWIEKDPLSQLEKTEIITKLVPHYKISSEIVKEMIGIEVEEREEQESEDQFEVETTDVEPQNRSANLVKRMYAKIFKE